MNYTFDPKLAATGTVLHVSLRFRNGQTIEELEVATEWAGETLRGVRNLQALSADTIISDTTSVGNKTIRHPPDQDVVLAYDVVKDWTGRFRHPAEFHGTLMPDYLELTADTCRWRITKIRRPSASGISLDNASAIDNN